MELFTLGEGNYSEDDIKQAARAFTGWSIDLDTGDYMFRRFLHDGGEKTVFGKHRQLRWRRGARHPPRAAGSRRNSSCASCGASSCRRSPMKLAVKRIAAQFRASGWNIAQPVRALLLQPEVIARDEDNALVKSPADLVVGFVRQSGGELTAAGCGRGRAGRHGAEPVFAAERTRLAWR